MKTSKTLAVFFWIFAAFLLLPLLIIIPISFTDADFLRFPPTSFGLRWYADYLTDPQWIDSTILSVRVAAFSSLLATVVGTLTALGIHRGSSGSKGPLLTYIGLPLVVPHIFVALGIFVIALRFGLLGSEPILIAAHATMGLPLVVLIVLAQVQQLDAAVERAARIHGATATRAFFAVTLPALRPSMIAGAIIAFFTSFDELTVALFLMTGEETLPMRLWANMKLDISPVIAPIATILIVVTTICLLFAEFIRRRASEATR
ncbi:MULTISPECIES: ABC transporter permease [Rhizobium]|uniref:ABC transporter permease n=1 Tax=Rhizobium leguminosarum bv. viciae TaxID=387 RepID=A0A8G2ISE6_RHILV|nr:ABC transporter permease [Rhizobium leguminosarum]NEI02819.1 ABC transporter permease subunit [Rhizobium leguminosarum]NKK10843.1 ABC transporter permease subunit [Rhizobium leguminosarum bv. viciae]NKK24309.1 ABC transporter permease subunit [Rhizobium leguminosarum bv. viciae]TBX86644.1 ABC transporter permease [Rhizobium leguminosarum bv. viciae]TBZ11600.1 ABC transporter permease [Rhizobium leguminosarum bv. viciae]